MQASRGPGRRFRERNLLSGGNSVPTVEVNFSRSLWSFSEARRKCSGLEVHLSDELESGHLMRKFMSRSILLGVWLSPPRRGWRKPNLRTKCFGFPPPTGVKRSICRTSAWTTQERRCRPSATMIRIWRMPCVSSFRAIPMEDRFTKRICFFEREKAGTGRWHRGQDPPMDGVLLWCLFRARRLACSAASLNSRARKRKTTKLRKARSRSSSLASLAKAPRLCSKPAIARLSKRFRHRACSRLAARSALRRTDGCRSGTHVEH